MSGFESICVQLSLSNSRRVGWIEDSLVAGRVDGSFSGRYVEFHENRRYVVFDGAVGGEQFVCDLGVRKALRKEF